MLKLIKTNKQMAKKLGVKPDDEVLMPVRHSSRLSSIIESKISNIMNAPLVKNGELGDTNNFVVDGSSQDHTREERYLHRQIKKA